MNRGNKILLGVLAFVVVCVIGYALFSETITVTGTATAKGNLELTTTALSDNEIESIWGLLDKGLITSSSITVSGNEVATNVTLGMPNSAKVFIIKVENTGTIPARLKSLEDVSDETYEEAANWFGAGKRNSDNTSYIGVEVFPDANFWDDYVDETAYWFEPAPDDSIYTAVLDPGEITYYSIEIDWAKRSTAQEEMNMNFKFKMNWEQVTVN